GCERILTSGQRPTAPEGAELINELVRQADDRIIIMPGSGIRADNITALAERTGASEFHTSARTKAPSRMEFVNTSMKDDQSAVRADREEIEKIKKLLTQRQQPQV
ncbi:MAG TPA: copper homeostasis protein CutC, partial [Puia sp.]